MQAYDSIPLTAPPTTIASFGGLYCHSAGSVGSDSETNLWYSPDASGNPYQLTRTITGNFDTFGQNIAYGTPPGGFTQEGGWIFLSGGILMQYGFYGKSGASGSSGTIQFPVTFLNNPYSIQLSLYRNSGSQTITLNSGSPPSTSSFNFLASSSGSDGVYWTAIGV